jgi:hypothetical protein
MQLMPEPRAPQADPPTAVEEVRSPATRDATLLDDFDDRETVVSVFGTARRAGPWAPPEQTRAIAGFANVVLDFTEANLPAGITEVDAHAIFGNVEIRVPASLQVELRAVAVLGNVVHRSERGVSRKRFRRWLGLARAEPSPESYSDEDAILSVRGVAFFGSIVVEVA